jgi:hypothetical protein
MCLTTMAARAYARAVSAVAGVLLAALAGCEPPTAGNDNTSERSFRDRPQETARPPAVPAPPAAPAATDRRIYGQPEGLKYCVDHARVKGHTFVVTVKIENITEDRKITYSPCQPTLRDFAGNSYASKGMPCDQRKSVYPQQRFFVDYVFEEPVDSVAAFFLTFSRQVEDPRTHVFKELLTVIGFDRNQIAPAAQKAAPRWLVSLPGPLKLSSQLTDLPTDWVNTFYPRGCTPWVETFPDGAARAVISICAGRLHGASAGLYRKGNIAALALYWQGSLTGPLRLWNEDRDMTLYSEYAYGKRNGLTITFRENKPVLVQTWDGGRLMQECLVDGDTATRVDQSTESEDLDGIHKQLQALTAQVAQSGECLKNLVRTLNARAGGMLRPRQAGGDSSGIPFRDVLSDAYQARHQNREWDEAVTECMEAVPPEPNDCGWRAAQRPPLKQ